jgi:3-oxoacid CoA-transferase B subunit
MMIDKSVTLSRRQMAWRAAQDLREGDYVNLGIGIPTLVGDYLPEGREIVFHSENGVLGVGAAPPEGQEDPDLINATKQPITLVPGGTFFRHDDSFVMIRGGHVNIALMGAYQVSGAGDLANWRTGDDTYAPAVGGAMDLAVGAREIRVLMEHTTRGGAPRIMDACEYPLTAAGVVDRIYTNLAVIDILDRRPVVREMVEGITFEDLQGATGATLTRAGDCKVLAPPAL